MRPRHPRLLFRCDSNRYSTGCFTDNLYSGWCSLGRVPVAYLAYIFRCHVVTVAFLPSLATTHLRIVPLVKLDEDKSRTKATRPRTKKAAVSCRSYDNARVSTRGIQGHAPYANLHIITVTPSPGNPLLYFHSPEVLLKSLVALAKPGKWPEFHRLATSHRGLVDGETSIR